MSPAGANDPGLPELAAMAGIAEYWTDARRRPQRVSADTLRALLTSLGLPAASASDVRESAQRLAEDAARLPPLLAARGGASLALPSSARGPCRIHCESGRVVEGRVVPAQAGPVLAVPDEPGYHALSFAGGQTAVLAVAPRQAPSLAELTGQPDARCWGLCAQVYSLRRGPGAGALGAEDDFGDFGALRELAVLAAEHGADALAISPVHAMYASQPGRCSPYSPSSRLFLNPLYANPAAVLGAAALRRAQVEEPGGPDGAACIDWPRAGARRQRLLRALHRQFRASAPADLRQRYARFCAQQGQALRDHAVFESLHAARGAQAPWTQWPAQWRDPESACVRRYARMHAIEVDFHQFAQWLAAESLALAHAAGREAGMRVGLIADLAVGDSPDGSHAWGRQADLLPRVAIGAPPDIHNPLGQNWGLTAFSPRALAASGYAAFIDMLRATLAHAGGLRIDHILGMARLWLVPEGAPPTEGAYLRYPLRTLLALTALEAWRHRALVIGENLGTVPDGFDQELADHGVLGMNVLWFMRRAPDPVPADTADPALGPPSAFAAARDWPPGSAAMTTTHDLPTLRGWWTGRDIDWRVKLGLLGPDDSEETLRRGRAADRVLLSQAMGGPAAAPPSEPPLADLLRFVSATPCPLLLVPMEDLAGALDQPNLPGTIDVHPNWRQRLPLDNPACFADPAARLRLDAMRGGRGRP
ncbi:4-alpha-glucanotransferase [Achromobacter veterisilvae]|uniref:4-alpha-glucanotransferase n=1 Tax=Achromobacter veterisilvae TaxID=2069367 RepID=A0A446CXV2_9BURK|nr:4-alpha-glucanotransferase [Achromobacter veterisilvae]SSW72657.1 4-alpha-glucanotransferase [Achromobacter veterisilvae]